MLLHSVLGGLNPPWKMSLSDIGHPPGSRTFANPHRSSSPWILKIPPRINGLHGAAQHWTRIILWQRLKFSHKPIRNANFFEFFHISNRQMLLHSVLGGLNPPWKMSLSDIGHPPGSRTFANPHRSSSPWILKIPPRINGLHGAAQHWTR